MNRTRAGLVSAVLLMVLGFSGLAPLSGISSVTEVSVNCAVDPNSITNYNLSIGSILMISTTNCQSAGIGGGVGDLSTGTWKYGVTGTETTGPSVGIINFALGDKISFTVTKSEGPIAGLTFYPELNQLGGMSAAFTVTAVPRPELISDLSSVCASTGPLARLATWSHAQSNHLLPDTPFPDSKWVTPLPYTATGLTSAKNATAATLGNVPTEKDTSRYLAYPFTTSAQTRIVLSQIGYGDSIAAGINIQAKLFAGSGPSAIAVTVGGVSAETANLVTNPTNTPVYFAETFDFPDTLLANNQAYELRFYIWGSSATITGYDDVYPDFVPCLPAPPTIGSISPTQTTLSVPFTAPSITGGSSVSNYQYSLDDGATWLTPSPEVTSSPLSITGLTEGQIYTVKMRTITTAGTSVPSTGVPVTLATTPAPVSEAPRQLVTIVNPEAQATVPKNRIVSISGTNLLTVTEVFVNGTKLQILRQTSDRIEIVIPKRMAGLVSLELKSPLNNVLSLRHFNLGSTKLTVRGFDHNSQALTQRMKNRIDRWLTRHSNIETLSCRGFTSLPKRTTDTALATNRGVAVCNFSKRVRPELVASVERGIQDPRPGTKIRRVVLVLTP